VLTEKEKQQEKYNSIRFCTLRNRTCRFAIKEGETSQCMAPNDMRKACVK
jgi:hypothetical protein